MSCLNKNLLLDNVLRIFDYVFSFMDDFPLEILIQYLINAIKSTFINIFIKDLKALSEMFHSIYINQ